MTSTDKIIERIRDVAAWIRAELGLIKRAAGKTRGDREAFLAGAEAGKSIHMGQSPGLGAGERGKLGSMTFRLGSGE